MNFYNSAIHYYDSITCLNIFAWFGSQDLTLARQIDRRRIKNYFQPNFIFCILNVFKANLGPKFNAILSQKNLCIKDPDLCTSQKDLTILFYARGLYFPLEITHFSLQQFCKKVSVNFFGKVRNAIKAQNNSYYPVCWHTLKQMCCGRVKLLSFLKHPVTAHSLVCAECFLQGPFLSKLFLSLGLLM